METSTLTNHINTLKIAINGLLAKGVSLETIKQYINELEESNQEMKWEQYYAVAQGHTPGIYATWDEAKAQITGYNGSKHKKFKTRKEAEAYINSHSFTKKYNQTTQKENNLIAFTDGACVNNNSLDLESRLAGYAVIWPNHKGFNRACKITSVEKKTNNRAELLACLEAIKIAKTIDTSCKQTLTIYADSELVMNTHKYIELWKKNGWRRSDNKPLSNVDILEDIYTSSREREIIIKHVAAHTNSNDWASLWNAKVDKAARDAALS